MPWRRGQRILKSLKKFGSIIHERIIRYTIGLPSFADAIANFYSLLFGKHQSTDILEIISAINEQERNIVIWSPEEEAYMVCDVLLEKVFSAQNQRFNSRGHLVVNWGEIAFVLNYVYRSIYGEGTIDIFTSRNCRQKYRELMGRLPSSLMTGVVAVQPEWAKELYTSHLLAYYLAGKAASPSVDLDNVENFIAYMDAL